MLTQEVIALMMNAVRVIVRQGRIPLLEEIEIPEGTEVLVTLLLDETDFWRRASESSLDAAWDNPEDDVYAKLLSE